MEMPTIAVAGMGVLAAIVTGVLIRRLESKHLRATAVRIEDEAVVVGRDIINIASIIRIEVAPMYDVAPADDVWIFRDDGGGKLSFFGRDSGATTVLRALETELAGFNFDRATQAARAGSTFEQAVTVWKR